MHDSRHHTDSFLLSIQVMWNLPNNIRDDLHFWHIASPILGHFVADTKLWLVEGSDAGMNADAVNQLVQVLERTTSGNQDDMKSAQQFLEQAAANNLPELIRSASATYSCSNCKFIHLLYSNKNFFLAEPCQTCCITAATARCADSRPESS